MIPEKTYKKKAMNLEAQSQLLYLQSANRKLIAKYQSLYYCLCSEEREMGEKMAFLLEMREYLQLKLRRQQFLVSNSIGDFGLGTTIMEFRPDFLKIERFSRKIFLETRWEACYTGEWRMIKRYFEMLYRQDLSPAVVDALLNKTGRSSAKKE